MKTGVFLIALLLLLAACGGGKAPAPLPIDTMVEILQEFHLAKAQIDTDQNNTKYRRAETEIMYTAILEKTAIDPDRFSYSYDYYLDHPILLDTIYVRVIRGLNEKMNREEGRAHQKTADPAANPSPAIDVDKSVTQPQAPGKLPATPPADQNPADPANRAR